MFAKAGRVLVMAFLHTGLLCASDRIALLGFHAVERFHAVEKQHVQDDKQSL